MSDAVVHSLMIECCPGVVSEVAVHSLAIGCCPLPDDRVLSRGVIEVVFYSLTIVCRPGGVRW